MKVPVYVRDMNEIAGAFVGHAEHTELESVVEMFNQDPGTGRAVQLNRNAWWPCALGDIDSDDYELIGAQFSDINGGKTLVFEVIIAQAHSA